MTRTEILNALIKKHNYQSYCEIGVEAGINFNAIECPEKVGVDPDVTSAATCFTTSDKFFENLKKINPDKKFDIFWIDGLHHADQVEQDIFYCLRHLSPGGMILMHDCLPTNERMQTIPILPGEAWTGDCWKAFVRMRWNHNLSLTMCTVDTDWGCGIIVPGGNSYLKPEKTLTYANFIQHEKEWMNIITVEEFKKRFL